MTELNVYILGPTGENRNLYESIETQVFVLDIQFDTVSKHIFLFF